MEQEILTSDQKLVLKAVVQEGNLSGFYLSGGTALACYYLHHRFSDDLDFFTFEEIDPIFIHSYAEKLKLAIDSKSFRFERLHDRYQFFFELKNRELKIEFARYPFSQLESPGRFDGILVDSFRDIAANKLMALLDRFDPKDFADLYFTIQKITLPQIRADVEKKFGHKISATFLAGELAKVRRIEALPKMIKPVTIEELKNFFAELIKGLSPEIF
ncbi:MAG: nucleotidyl transferase AbiEii/AbiGii toxin family protein [Patescibacteria group bacterium]